MTSCTTLPLRLWRVVAPLAATLLLASTPLLAADARQEQQRKQAAAAQQARAAQAAARNAATAAAVRAAQTRAREQANLERSWQQAQQRMEDDLIHARRAERDAQMEYERNMTEMYVDMVERQRKEEADAEGELRREQQLLEQHHAQEQRRRQAELDERQRKLRVERDKKALASFQALQARLASGQPVGQEAHPHLSANAPGLAPVSVPRDNPFVAPDAATTATTVNDPVPRVTGPIRLPSTNPWGEAPGSPSAAPPPGQGTIARGVQQR